MKKSRRKVLCRIPHQPTGTMIIYINNTWRWDFQSPNASIQWHLVHSDLGPMFFYRDDEEDAWATDWNSLDETEIKVAETIAKALVDLEMDNILKK